MNTRQAAPAAITILLAILGGALISADEPESSPQTVAHPDGAAAFRQLRFTVTEGDVYPLLGALQNSHPEVVFQFVGNTVAAVGSAAELDSVYRQLNELGQSKDAWPAGLKISDAFIYTKRSQRPRERARPGDGGEMRSARVSSSSGGPPVVDTDHTEMVLRLSAPDLVSGIRMRVGEEDTKKILDAVQTSNPDVSFEIVGNMIIARGSVAALRALRPGLLALGQTEDARDWPPGLQVDVYGWREPRQPAQVTPEQTTFIHLEHASASNVADVLMKLYPTAGQIVAEPSTNTLILRATNEQLEEVQAIVQRLEDAARERRDDQRTGGGGTNTADKTIESPLGQTDSEIGVFPLRNVLAQELSPTLRELYAQNIKVTVNDRTNSLLVIAPPETLGRIEDLVRQLDQPADTTAATTHNDAAKPQAAAEAEREYAAAERRAAALAAQADKTVRDVARLRAAVGQAFEWRQRRQRAELELLRARLKTIERDIDRRDRIREEVIERRVEELLKPELRWDRGERPAAPDADALGTAQVPPPLDGIVTAVDKGNLIEISLGSDDGLRVGQRLEVFRDDTNLGHAVVQRIAPDRAMAKLDDKTKQGTIKVGDGVATKLNPKTSPPGGSVPPTPSRDAGRLGAGPASSADIAAAEAELSEAERHYDHTEAMVKKGFQKQSDLEVARRAAESAQAKLRNAQREYEAQRRLLQLDVESAKVKVLAAAAALEAVIKSDRLGVGPPPSVQQFALQQAELELKRVQTRLDLHTADQSESKSEENPPNVESPKDQTDAGASNPASSTHKVNPSTAVVWIEALFESQNDPRQREAAYMNGTVVSREGLIAVALSPESDQARRLKSVRVYLDDSRIVGGQLVADDAESGLGLVRVEARDLPFLSPSNDLPAANQRLRMHAMQVSANGQKDRRSEEVRVEQWNDRRNPPRFSLAPSPRHRFLVHPSDGLVRPTDAGAALVATGGELEGIVAAVDTTNRDDGQSSVGILPATLIHKLLDGEGTSAVNPAAPQVTDRKDEKSPIDKSSLDKVSKQFRHDTRVANGLVTSGGVIERIEDNTIHFTSGDSIVVGSEARITMRTRTQRLVILVLDWLEPGMAVNYSIKDGKVQSVRLVGIVESGPDDNDPFERIKDFQLRKGGQITDSLDGRHPIRVVGSDGEVLIKLGETKLIRMPKPTTSFEWRSGDFTPETIDDVEPFDHVLVQWRANGRITWTFYQSPSEANGGEASARDQKEDPPVEGDMPPLELEQPAQTVMMPEKTTQTLPGTANASVSAGAMPK